MEPVRGTGSTACVANSILGRQSTTKGERAMGSVTDFTDQNFEAEVIKSDEPVLVDFWAPWCGPCRMIAPVVEELASENAGKVKIGKLNVDDSPSSAAAYGVSSIPTLILFKGGEVVNTFVGLKAKQELQQAIDSAKN